MTVALLFRLPNDAALLFRVPNDAEAAGAELSDTEVFDFVDSR